MDRLEALMDPLRLRLMRRLSTRDLLALPELVEAAGAHPNTVRAHLAAMEEAGLVRRERLPPAGRGQPAAAWRLAPDYTPPASDFRGLAELLGAALARKARTPEELREVGFEWGRYLRGRPGEKKDLQDLVPALARLGFEAEVDGKVVRLNACPCPLVIPDRPALVCDLAIAVIDGFLAASGSNLRVGKREHDNDARRCAAKLTPPQRRGPAPP